MKFELNRRTLQVQMVRDDELSTPELLRRVKYQFRSHINNMEILDGEILDLISKVKGGTRNIRYLVNGGNVLRLRDIANFIVHQIT